MMRTLTAVIRILLVVLLVVSTIRVTMYAADYLQARRASAVLREMYHDVAEQSITPAPAVTPAPTVAASVTPAATPELLAALRYPNNPEAEVGSRFAKIRRQNSDIIGWLTIDELVDEAVVQRDNEYYLDRDYRGYHNVNGAIFLDERCDLSTRPYTLMLFGHNMKNGLMFGSLRNYEDVGFYRRNPLITFDTAYEDGRYVIFSIATVSLDPKSSRFLDVSALRSTSVSRRSETISALKRLSRYSATIDVEAEDQLLLLITCVESDEERRVIAARRIRADENEERVAKYVQGAQTK